jgi:YebC/PmpR family DNA-binding regulatory protein
VSGHTHAQNIRRKKAVIDKKRGKLFSKLAKAITIAARAGGGDPNMNLALKYAIDKGKQGNMPKDVIERSIKKGTGELEGMGDLIEQKFEGVTAGGVHVIAMCLTDNKNRTASEIRKMFDMHGGKLGGPGATAWMFDRKGIILIPLEQIDEEALMEIVLEAGAEDLSTEDGMHEVTTSIEDFETVRQAVMAKELDPETAELMNVPKNRIKIDDPKLAKRILKFLDALDDHEDVQEFSSNEDIPDELVSDG